MKSFLKFFKKRGGSKRGFSLIEVVIGIAVITLVITAAAEVTRSSIVMGSITNNELIAHNHAEEGLEIVRNMRDSNWMQNKKWDTDLDDGEYVIVFTTPENRLPDTAQAPWTLLKLDAALQNTNDRFRPIIKLEHITSGEGDSALTSLKVTSTVTYSERRTPNKVISFDTILTDWKQGPI